MSEPLYKACEACNRGAEACEYCHNLEYEDWEACCDCGLNDLGVHIPLCEFKEDFRYVIASSYESSQIKRET